MFGHAMNGVRIHRVDVTSIPSTLHCFCCETRPHGTVLIALVDWLSTGVACNVDDGDSFSGLVEVVAMNESFEITPGRSVGPFTLGMPRREIWSLHRCPITSFYSPQGSERRTDDFTLLGIHVYYDDNDCANSIEAHMSVQYNRVSLILDGNRINSLSVGELREICLMLECPIKAYDFGFEAPSIGLSVYSHDYEDDNSKVDAVSVMART